MMCELLFIVLLSNILNQASIYLISYVWVAAAYKRNYFNSNSNSPFCQFWGLTTNSIKIHTKNIIMNSIKNYTKNIITNSIKNYTKNIITYFEYNKNSYQKYNYLIRIIHLQKFYA